jgi:hypothetical protein
MNRPLLILLALTFALTGCTTLNHRDRDFLESHGIRSGPVYDKMMHHEPLTVDDIIELNRRGIPGPFIVHYLRPTYAVYNLTPSDMAQLRGAGVPEGVIRYLRATPGMYSPNSVPLIYRNYPPTDPLDRDWYDWHY